MESLTTDMLFFLTIFLAVIGVFAVLSLVSVIYIDICEDFEYRKSGRLYKVLDRFMNTDAGAFIIIGSIVLFMAMLSIVIAYY